MIKNIELTIYIIAFSFLSLQETNSQSITINADSYRQEFKGVGTSIGLYIWHHFSMNATNQDKAMRMINKDLNMTYIQDYIQYYPSNSSYYDVRANYIKSAKVYQPNSKVAMVYDNFPDELRKDKTVDGEVIRILDVTRPSIYSDLANWYFLSLKGFQERGVVVDILSVCNEPDFIRQHHFGFGNPRFGVSKILQEAIPKLKEMLADPSINATNIKLPLIMAPSNLSTVSCLEYVRDYKNNFPKAWEQIDIVATHQYGGGYDSETITNIKNELDGRAFYQSEMHADHVDNLNLGNLVERPHRASLDLSGLFNVAMNNGIEAWYYFENNYPQNVATGNFHPGGLISVPWGGRPLPFKHYYAFKQITSRQPIGTNVLNQNLVNLTDSEVSSFRKINQDSIYVNVSNFTSRSKQVPIEIKKNTGANYGIKYIEIMSTDGFQNAEITQKINFDDSIGKYVLNVDAYSIKTLTIALDASYSLSTDYFNKPNFTIYSFDKELNIVSDSNLKVKNLQIFSVTGQLIKEYKNTGNLQKFQVNFPTGIYIVKVLDDSEKISVKKVYIK